MSRESLQRYGVQIARRVAESALWDGERCTWMVRKSARTAEVDAVEPAGPDLYRGAAGIALALGEAYRVSGDAGCRRAALGAANHAVTASRQGPPALCGFHSGPAGVAFVLARLAESLDAPSMHEMAIEMARGLQVALARDTMYDVIAGAAGAIPALLYLARSPGFEFAKAAALAGGERLLERAERHPEGWCWGTKPGQVRGLTGFAHGASGIAVALLELAAVTADARFAFAAEQAMAYERHYFLPDRQNWPDFRAPDVLEALAEGQEQLLRERVRRGEDVHLVASSSMLAWCHGAPGIGLARFRALQLCPDDSVRAEAELAAGVTYAGLMRRNPSNFSLCHGVAGNIETLLLGATALGAQHYREAAEHAMLEGADRFESPGSHWPGGSWHACHDVSLLLGDAGIAYQFLRIADPSVPSVLMVEAPCGPETPPPHRTSAIAIASLRQAEGMVWWGRSLQRLARLGNVPAAGTSPNSESFVELVGNQRDLSPGIALKCCLEALAGQAVRDPSSDSEFLRDAIATDAARVALLSTQYDRAQEYLDWLTRDDTDEVDWDGAHWTISGRVQVVHRVFAWDEWDPSASATPARLAASRRSLVLVRRGLEVEEFEISPFTARIFEELQQPVTLAELLASLRVEKPPEAAAHNQLSRAVAAQVRHAFDAGLVIRVWRAAACAHPAAPSAVVHAGA